MKIFLSRMGVKIDTISMEISNRLLPGTGGEGEVLYFLFVNSSSFQPSRELLAGYISDSRPIQGILSWRD